MNQLSPKEWDDLMQACEANVEAMQSQGHYCGGEALQPVEIATTVRMRQGRLITTDGPFAETKEQLAGYCMLEAESFEQALALAGQLPPLRYGCIEVRPVRDLATPPLGYGLSTEVAGLAAAARKFANS